MKKALQLYSNKSDAEIIEIYKNNPHWRTRQDVESYFYAKYQPLVKSQAIKFSYLSSVEDNCQECYFLMLSALDWIDLSKVDLEQFSFGGVFKRYITAHFIGEVNSKKVENENKVETIDLTPEQGALFGKKFYNGSKVVESHEDSLIFKMNLKEFKKSLTEKELNLVELLETNMYKKDITKELGFKNTPNLTHWVEKVQSKYRTFMNNAGYELAI